MGTRIIYVGIMLTGLSTLVVALRLYSRHFLVHMVGASDCIMSLALLSTWSVLAVNICQSTYGKNAKLSIVQKHPNSPTVHAALKGTLVTWFIYRPLYNFTISLVKLSILAFYRTLVPPDTSFRSFRVFCQIVNGLIIFTPLYTIAMVAASILQCQPISAAYSPTASLSQLDDKLPRPKCYYPTNFWIFCGAVNFFTDIMILGLPLPIIASLKNMPRRKRAGLFAIFAVGALGIAASAVRFWIVVIWGKDPHTQGKYGTDLLMWGQVELNSGILSTSAPFLRPLFRDSVRWWRQRREKNSKRVEGMDGTEIRGDMTEKEFEVVATEKIIDGRSSGSEEVGVLRPHNI